MDEPVPANMPATPAYKENSLKKLKLLVSAFNLLNSLIIILKNHATLYAGKCQLELTCICHIVFLSKQIIIIRVF